MKALRFTEAQKAFVLKQGEEGTPVAEVCRRSQDDDDRRDVSEGAPHGL